MTSTQITGKTKIIETALQEFADRGFEGARMDRIANNAGVNKALIYYHYKSKEELYVAAIDYLFVNAVPETNFAATGSARQSMMFLLEQFTTFLHHNPIFIKMMDQEVLRGGDMFRQAHQQFKIVQHLLQLYEIGVQNGECRRLDHPVDYMMSMLGACYFFYSHRNNIASFYREPMEEAGVLSMRIRTLQDIADKVFFIGNE